MFSVERSGVLRVECRRKRLVESSLYGIIKDGAQKRSKKRRAIISPCQETIKNGDAGYQSMGGRLWAVR